MRGCQEMKLKKLEKAEKQQKNNRKEFHGSTFFSIGRR
jgi:hypothetical protein